MQKILVSRCLLGERVRYDGGAHGPFAQLEAWRRQGRLVAVCPEVAGGLPTPRPPAEIPGGQGARVLEGECAVLTIDGAEVGAAFLAGAHAALQLVEAHGIRLAVLKARSPSCGNRENYDGSFRAAGGYPARASPPHCCAATGCGCSARKSWRRRPPPWRRWRRTATRNDHWLPPMATRRRIDLINCAVDNPPGRTFSYR